MSSDADLDAKLTELLRVMVSRLPPNKKLPTAVVQQLLRTKYGETYSEAYVQSHEAFIADAILQLAIAKENAAAVVKHNDSSSVSSSSAAASDDDDASDDESDEDSDSGEEEEEEDAAEDEEVSADSEEDDEGDDNSTDDDSDYDDSDDDDAAPDRKKARQEELDAITRKEQRQSQQKESTNGEAAGSNGTTVTLAERCKAMAECLRKLSYRVRAPSESETLEEYLHGFLIAEFKKHEMDPEKFSKSDIKRYRIKREVELLQQDGASLSLDRRNRAGRGFSNVVIAPDGGAQAAAAAPAMVAKQTSMFLDDE
ncbi:hypothetical protein ABB37_08472 [Leptomonas pyrrhocoris]|uniref:Uncharacterized protein n=1 Tax=Leptomonas pyrrhocoris TaxID=157538 RepID=A0A0M9FTK2_LEPPY|nr:hypothetical protein ABB37_08472 [Leptomonas pyrrhocoris]KPA75596.1 hypothetical protein ABB37_08472 [Leptomonas pyrrhocoris]|eukprot:XP_015654035.1 hypothetical protein ABB37_08472 [Leptomonas pyrrhocoris]